MSNLITEEEVSKRLNVSLCFASPVAATAQGACIREDRLARALPAGRSRLVAGVPADRRNCSARGWFTQAI